ncbi:MAG: AraC family transcriptional regulator [Clostridiales bacterium]|nr:AraC family transcriptional regulator [Clostridiales bacterium]
MKIIERGVLPNSEVYFHTASEAARRMYFYLRCTGHFYCDENYAVNRQSYSSFLILYVARGSGYAYIENRRVELSEGYFALLDCFAPHRYGTQTGWEIYWIHFHGVTAREYYNVIVQNKNQFMLPLNPYSTARDLERIFSMFDTQKRTVEPLISKYITSLLTEFVIYNGTQRQTTQSSGMEQVLNYIAENVDKNLTLAELAQKAALSPYYFSRVFKKEIGYSPHEYLIIARVNTAKFYLKTSVLPIKEIAFRCGFSSECNFCTTFKRIVSITPLTYRNSGQL